MKEGPWAMHCTIHSEADAAATFTNMPAADAFLFNSHRHVIKVDASGFTEVRLKVNKQGTAGLAGSTLRLAYSETFSTSAGSYKDVGVSAVSVSIDTTNSLLDSGWVEITPDAFVPSDDDIYVAVIGNGGNGTLDPQFGNISVSFR